MAALVRVFFTNITTVKDTAKTFLGGVLLGMLVGYLSNDIQAVKGYVKVIVVLGSIVGKELFDWLRSVAKDPVAVVKSIKNLKSNP